ncbi:MAG: branched-chain amino acid ABC transporter permease [Oscillospiraceae bacterium]|nr:branched-chain amino acid ABC transporter permease [Oscillospiraceae bacterium]
MFIQQLINGLAIGSVYALMTVGYSLIYSLMSFTNFAHGVVVTISAYIGFFVLTFFTPSIPLGILVSLLGGLVVSVVIELITYRPLLLRNARRLYLCIAGLGLSIMVENLIIVALSGRFKSYPPEVLNLGSVSLGKANVGIIDLLILGVSLVALLALELYIRKSREGLAIRGAAFSLDYASIMGINTDGLMIKVFAIAGALAGIAGFFCGIKYTAYPKLGGSLTNKSFISAVLGGLGSLPGAILGSFILGILEVMVAGYVSSTLRDVFSFSLLVFILLVKPTGLLGKSSEDKA